MSEKCEKYTIVTLLLPPSPPPPQPTQPPPSVPPPPPFQPPALRTCGVCGAVRMGMADHMDAMHVNVVTVELWPGEVLTIHQREGLFHCRWCIDRAYGGCSRFSTASTRGIKVRFSTMQPQQSAKMLRPEPPAVLQVAPVGDNIGPQLPGQRPGPRSARAIDIWRCVTRECPRRARLVGNGPSRAEEGNLVCDDGDRVPGLQGRASGTSVDLGLAPVRLLGERGVLVRGGALRQAWHLRQC